MRWTHSRWIALCAALLAPTHASRLTPPVLPLVVRNPYLSTWLADAREAPWLHWPIFYEGQTVGLSVLASVPGSGNVYALLGKPQDSLELDAHDSYNISYPHYLGAKYDAATTNLSYEIPADTSDVAPVEITLSFLTPITPTSTLRQSIPAGYISVHVKGSFDINVYIDINGNWVSGDSTSRIAWDLACSPMKAGAEPGPLVKSWRLKKETEQLFSEQHDQAEWGTLHFTADGDVQHESGPSYLVRQQFARTGTLSNKIDGSFRSIADEEPVFAFAKSFHLNSSHQSSTGDPGHALFTIAHLQDPVVQFASARGLTFMRPLWASWFSSAEELVIFHHLDFGNAVSLAANYSTQLAADAARSGSQDYVDILALSARQVLAATSFSGTPDDPLLFLKEISSNGNCQTIDVIFPSFPFFMYTNPRWLAYLLEPLFEHMLSGQYPNTYAMHDLGAHFPNITGHPDGQDEYMPVEECGNMLLMGLALVNSLLYEDESTSGSVWASMGSSSFVEGGDLSPFALRALESRDGVAALDDRWGGRDGSKGHRQARKFIRRTYRLWKQWTGYLVEYSLTPETQLSTDDFAGWLANQTNLALKGILGIKAMSKLAEAIDETADVEYYTNISSSYVRQWGDYAISRDGTHAKLSYNWYGSWTTLYNLFADSMLCFHLLSDNTSAPEPAPVPATTRRTASPIDRADQAPLLHPNEPEQARESEQAREEAGFVPKSIYRMQSRWYHFVMQKYGLPLDSRHLYAKSDWQFFAAAVASTAVRDEILDKVARWVNETVTDLPLTDLYMTEGQGGWPSAQFKARPVVGGHFAFVALERACAGKAVDGLLRFLE